MPKQKTHSGAKKRFKVTATGKVKYAKPNRGHFMTEKSQKSKRDMRKGGYVQGKPAENIKKMLNK